MKFPINYSRVFFIAVFSGVHFYGQNSASEFNQGHSTSKIFTDARLESKPDVDITSRIELRTCVDQPEKT